MHWPNSRHDLYDLLTGDAGYLPSARDCALCRLIVLHQTSSILVHLHFSRTVIAPQIPTTLSLRLRLPRLYRWHASRKFQTDKQTETHAWIDMPDSSMLVAPAPRPLFLQAPLSAHILSELDSEVTDLRVICVNGQLKDPDVAKDLASIKTTDDKQTAIVEHGTMVTTASRR
jgi:hypothetical protein